jgi:hypothetical protein
MRYYDGLRRNLSQKHNNYNNNNIIVIFFMCKHWPYGAVFKSSEEEKRLVSEVSLARPAYVNPGIYCAD